MFCTPWEVVQVPKDHTFMGFVQQPAVMADREFNGQHQLEDAALKLCIPSILGESRPHLAAEEVTDTRPVAEVRINVT